MKLYYHQTDGGAEYYCVKYTTTPDDERHITHINENGEGCAAVMRTDGGEIEIFTERLRDLGIKLVIR